MKKERAQEFYRAKEQAGVGNFDPARLEELDQQIAQLERECAFVSPYENLAEDAAQAIRMKATEKRLAELKKIVDKKLPEYARLWESVYVYAEELQAIYFEERALLGKNPGANNVLPPLGGADFGHAWANGVLYSLECAGLVQSGSYVKRQNKINGPLAAIQKM